MAFKPRSIQKIIAEMAASLSAETPINDYTPGSVALSLLETAAQEDFQQYIQMIEVVRNYSLDTTENEDLNRRAFEFGLVRIGAKPHSGFVTISDTRFSKIQTKLYGGLSGPTAGAITINVEDGSSLPASGSLYIGRGTENSEGPVAYSVAPVDNSAYWTITLDAALVNDHGTDETVILSQFGIRNISAGSEVRVPENDFSEEILFELNQSITILDGEDSIENVLVTALDPSGISVPKNSVREFVNPPFTGATVLNPSPFVNGRDEETDQELRDRIRETIQSLSRGTAVSVRTAILGLTDNNTNSSISSANLIPPVVLADGPTKVYIDNGRGLEPEVATFGLETLISSATGGEKFFQLSEFPLVKASVVSQLTEPFNLVGGETLIIKVGNSEETITFNVNDFSTAGLVTATEVAEAINNSATSFEARTITDETGARIIITPLETQNEFLTVNSASTSNTVFNFSTDTKYTLKLYKNDKLLTKDGFTASVTSAAQPYDLSSSESTSFDDVNITSESDIVTKSPGVDDFQILVSPGDFVKSEDDPDTFYTKVKAVLSPLLIALEEPYPNGSVSGGTSKLDVWSSPQLELSSNGDQYETEIVSFSKNDFSNPSSVLATEIIDRLQKEINHSKVELTLNNTAIQITSLLQNNENSKIKVLGGQGGISLGFITSSPLTGSCDFVANNTLVQGTGTLFTQELEEGQWIKSSPQNNGSWTKIATILDDDTLYLAEPYRGDSVSSTVTLKTSFGEESVGAGKDYTLNKFNGQIELEEPLVVGDKLTAGSINTRAFADSIPGPYDFDTLGVSSTLIVRVDGGFQLTVTSFDNIAPYNTITSTSLIGYAPGSFVGDSVECTSGNNSGESDIITAYNHNTGTLTTASGFSNQINNSDVFVISQTLEIDHSLFADPENVSVAEVVSVLSGQLEGGTIETSSDKVRIRSNSFLSSQLQVVGGSANSILDFETSSASNQESNIAYLVSSNTDRDGLTIQGYTLAPNQNLVVILDEDNINKNFTVPMSISGEITGGAALSLEVSSFIGVYPTDFFNDFWVYWKSGSTNEGTLQYVTAYNGTTGTLTTDYLYPSSAPPATPTIGDTVLLVPRTCENVVSLFKDLNTTTFSSSGRLEALGTTGDYLQISTKRPGTEGKVLVSGGSANSLGIPILNPDNTTPEINDVLVNSKAGLTKGMPVKITTNLPSEEIVFISDITGTSSPYVVSLTDVTGSDIDASTYTSSNEAVLSDVNNLGFGTSQVEGIDGYKFYSGLIQLTQWTIDGLDRDSSNYPGIAAAGTQFEVLTPLLVKLEVIVNVTPVDGVSLSSISDSVSSEILAYVNSRKVGEDVILSEIVTAAQQVAGVFDVEVTNHIENIVIADGELARLDDEDLIVG